jgi:hypothetical protein
MANTIDDKLVDRLYAMSLKALRRRTSILNYVTRKDDEVNTPGFKGQNVIIPLPATMSDAEEVSPSNTPPAPSNITPGYAEVSLNNWKKKSFALTDLEVSRLQSGTMTSQFTAAIDALARTVVKSVWTLYKGIYTFTGTAGTTPFASSTVDAQNAMYLLNLNGAPIEDRALVLGYKAHANATGLSAFQNYQNANSEETLREGYIGRALGFDWDQDGYLPSFTGGTLSNGTTKTALINEANVAVGDTTVPMDSATLTGTLVIGDLFTVAGDAQQYTVTANATASGNAIASVSFTPSAKVAWANDAVVTFVASHDVAGVALQKQAIAFASKPIDDVQFPGGSIIRQVPDPESGLVLCLEISRQYKQTMAEFSILWGATLARPECAVRILG